MADPSLKMGYLLLGPALGYAALVYGYAQGMAKLPADISYGVYIYGWPIAQAIVAIWGAMDKVSLALWGVVGVLPVAIAGWYLVEKPMLKKRFFGAPPDGGGGRGPSDGSRPRTEVKDNAASNAAVSPDTQSQRVTVKRVTEKPRGVDNPLYPAHPVYGRASTLTPERHSGPAVLVKKKAVGRRLWGVPLPVIFFFFGMMLPTSAGVSAGGLRLSVYRVVLIIMFLPMLYNLLLGKRAKMNIFDFFVIVHSLWATMALIKWGGLAQGIESGGIYVVEFMGA